MNIRELLNRLDTIEENSKGFKVGQPYPNPHPEEELDEVAPPGREDQVKALKGKVDNPWAVSWASYNKSKKKAK